MAQNILESLKRTFEQESFAERSQRMIPAAACGAFIAAVYVLTLSLINVYTFPSLPLGVDWGRVFLMLIGFGLALAIFGAVAAWFTEEYLGIVGGGVIATILAAIVFLFSARGQSTPAVQAIIMAFPLLGVSMLGAWGLRWTAHRYLALKQDTSPDHQKRMAKFIGTLLLIGLIPGILMRMDLTAEQSLKHFDDLLRAAPSDPSVWPQLPLKQVPSLKDHFGKSYVFYPRQSALSAGALDVTVQFADGFTMSCLLPTGSGADFITQCNEGKIVKSPGT